MNRGVHRREFIDPFEHSTDVRHTHTAKKPNETTSEETAAAVSRFQSAIASHILKSGHSERPIEYF